jgi:hypothetical protein
MHLNKPVGAPLQDRRPASEKHAFRPFDVHEHKVWIAVGCGEGVERYRWDGNGIGGLARIIWDIPRPLIEDHRSFGIHSGRMENREVVLVIELAVTVGDFDVMTTGFNRYYIATWCDVLREYKSNDALMGSDIEDPRARP